MKKREDVLISDLCKEVDFLRETLKQTEKERDYYEDKWAKSIQASIKASVNNINFIFAAIIAAETKDIKLAKAISSSMNDGDKS